MKKLFISYIFALLPGFIITQFVMANPIPVGVPYVLMTNEDIRISISEDWIVDVMGIYTFNVIYIDPFPYPGYINGEGTIRYIDLEGGFFGIVGDDGGHYDPINLTSNFI